METKTPARLVRLNDSNLTVAGVNEDIRGRKVLDASGEEIGHVDDLLIDESESKVRFLQVAAGRLLGLGETKFLIPVDAVKRIDVDHVHIDQSRERIAGAPRYNPDLIEDNDYNSVYGYYPDQRFESFRRGSQRLQQRIRLLRLCALLGHRLRLSGLSLFYVKEEAQGSGHSKYFERRLPRRIPVESKAMKTVVAAFDRYGDADLAVEELHRRGIDNDQISVLARESAVRDRLMAESADPLSKGMAAGAVGGGAIGGLGGMLLGLSTLAIPGLAATFIVGVLGATMASTALGAGLGALAGSVIGGLVKQGVPEADAHVYAESVKGGAILLAVQAHDEGVPQVESVLHDAQAVPISLLRERLRSSGWKRFEETSNPP